MPDRAMITDPDTYFAKGCGRCDRFATPDCSTRRWLAGLLTLRRIAREAGLTEGREMGPSLLYARGPQHLPFRCFPRRLPPDHHQRRPDAGSPKACWKSRARTPATPTAFRFTDTAACQPRWNPRSAPIWPRRWPMPTRASSRRRSPTEVELPPELVEALDADPDLAEAFAALTPGRQKSWALHLNDAKTSATRVTRIGNGAARRSSRGRARLNGSPTRTERVFRALLGHSPSPRDALRSGCRASPLWAMPSQGQARPSSPAAAAPSAPGIGIEKVSEKLV
jgi:hypothetical protein